MNDTGLHRYKKKNGRSVISMKIAVLVRQPLSMLPPVRFGSLADITARSRHVRFTPESGHSSVQVGCPKSATSGHPAVCDLEDEIGLRERVDALHLNFEICLAVAIDVGTLQERRGIAD